MSRVIGGLGSDANIVGIGQLHCACRTLCNRCSTARQHGSWEWLGWIAIAVCDTDLLT